MFIKLIANVWIRLFCSRGNAVRELDAGPGPSYSNWEDADNADGGLWTFKFHKDFTVGWV